jgi:hypothetical protein
MLCKTNINISINDEDTTIKNTKINIEDEGFQNKTNKIVFLL